ncbi:Chaperone protein dnaJ 15 [Zostera marina]|uniref:Chaperone protein dnaJ 15 n=1 Tax=Zostera marina TaxID=29655 RepID=A0A0K9P0I3_ZOSMR|nr:Chaperone protein dnaJ 15 [Zostera marina]
MNTMFAALFSKLGIPLKTSVSVSVIESALNGTVTVTPLPLGKSSTRKVDKQCAQFFGVTIDEEQARLGIVVRVTSSAQSKFKLLYFEQESNGGYGLALQEDSQITGEITSAGMYFLHFQVYRLNPAVNTLAVSKDPEAVLFKKLDGFHPCEVSELKSGPHIFAVYGDNFFKSSTYTIEAMCAKSYEQTSEKLKGIEAKLLAKKNDLHRFESEYRKAAAHFQEVTNKYAQEKEVVNNLLTERDAIQASFTTVKPTANTIVNNGGGIKVSNGDFNPAIPKVNENINAKDKFDVKKWFSKWNHSEDKG